MTTTKWFVMLRGYDCSPIQLVDLEDSIVLFDSQGGAFEAASRNTLGGAFGFELYPWEKP